MVMESIVLHTVLKSSIGFQLGWYLVNVKDVALIVFMSFAYSPNLWVSDAWCTEASAFDMFLNYFI